MGRFIRVRLRTSKDMHSKLNECLDFILHTEFLATLARIKPLSIIRAFEEPEFEAAWINAWIARDLQNTDIVWKLKNHESGPTLWVASRSALKLLSINQGENDLLEAIESTSLTMSSQEESHRFWGTVLGIPNSEVEEYSRLNSIERKLGNWTLMYPHTFASQVPCGFVSYNSDSEDVVKFLNRTKLATEEYRNQVASGKDLVALINDWNLFP